MYIDDTVIAGLLVVGGTLAFLSGFAYFVYQDIQSKRKQKH